MTRTGRRMAMSRRLLRRRRPLRSPVLPGEGHAPTTRPLTDAEHGELLDHLVERARRECPTCGRLMSDREADEQGACNDCADPGRRS